MSEKTEKATPFKLQKAKEKGQTGKSIELISSMSLLIMFTLFSIIWPDYFKDIKTVLKQLLYLATQMNWNLDTLAGLSQLLLLKIINWWLPFALSGVIAIIISTIIQTGIICTIVPITPDFKRLNLLNGIKKIASLKTCFEAFKISFKLILALLLMLSMAKNQLHHLFQATLSQTFPNPELFIPCVLKLPFQLLLLLVAMSVLDKRYSSWKFNKDHRMTKQEIKDEYRQKEGDPKIKNKIRQLQHQLRQKTASLKQVQSADVVITNPTHLAIALKYDKHLMPAPKVICKAQGEHVLYVKKIARKYNIPVIENKPLARILYQSVELNQWIGKELFPVAASIFREVYKQQRVKPS